MLEHKAGGCNALLLYAALDKDIDSRLEEDFADKLKLLEGFKGIGDNTKAVSMAALPELSQLNRRQIGKPDLPSLHGRVWA